jgi:CO/xanthine dehydrogenase FAD-binding subunit
VIPTAFNYHRATSLDDALKAMAAAGGNGKFVAAELLCSKPMAGALDPDEKLDLLYF